VIDRRLRILILLFLWAVLVEDTLLFVMAWVAPDLWFRVFHVALPACLDVAWLRRSAGQWIAFSLVQGATLWLWKREPLWLAATAVARFTDLFTDISYVVSAPTLTHLGWIFLLPPPVLNFIGIVIMLLGYRQMRSSTTREGQSAR
jgi:hypothetical protein